LDPALYAPTKITLPSMELFVDPFGELTHESFYYVHDQVSKTYVNEKKRMKVDEIF
jgi:hypothetical protein